MGKKVDMIGKRFGKLVVIEETNKRDANGTIYYLCQCDCGNQKIINGKGLRHTGTVSCGCYNLIKSKKENPNYKHPLYSIYRSIKDRCTNPNCKAFKNYGGRGICVSSEWSSFDAFKEWALSNGYQKGLWIDRIDNDGNYGPDNCRWATPKEQQNNKRVCVYITVGGKTQTMMQWAEEKGINHRTLKSRYDKGIRGDDLFAPIDKRYSHSDLIKQYYERKKAV